MADQREAGKEIKSLKVWRTNEKGGAVDGIQLPRTLLRRVDREGSIQGEKKGRGEERKKKMYDMEIDKSKRSIKMS